MRQTSDTRSISEILLQNLQRFGILSDYPSAKLVVAFSGGSDSTVLLDALCQLKANHPLEIIAAYYNHQWRKGAPRELPVLHKITEQNRIPLVIIGTDLSLPKTETAAREFRYKQFCKLAQDLQANAVLTAHHADDQTETILFRLLRGTGIDGLTGIQRQLILNGQTIPILRPMLDVPKSAILKYAHEKQLTYFDDPTNTDTRKQRNLLRQKILPMLETDFPNVKQALGRLSDLAEADAGIIQNEVDALWVHLYRSDEKGYYLDSQAFNQLTIPLQRRLVKRFLLHHDLPISYKSIDDTLAFLQGRHRHNLSSGLMSLDHNPANGKPRYVSLYKNKFRLVTPPEKSTATPMEVALTGVTWSEAMQAAIHVYEVAEKNKIKMSRAAVLKASTLLDPLTAYVELTNFLPKPDDGVRYYGEPYVEPTRLMFRTRQPGDRFQPLGMTSTMKLKRYLINKGISRFERDAMPMLAYGNEILWIPGVALSHKIRVSKLPTHRLQLEYCSEAPEPIVEIIEEEPVEPLEITAPEPTSEALSEAVLETDDEPTTEESEPIEDAQHAHD